MKPSLFPLISRLLVVVLLAVSATAQDDEPEPETPSPLQAFRDQLKSNVTFCAPGLANAYGMNGLLTPFKLNKTGWMFCPSMTSVCCSNDDAESAFATLNGGLKRLKQHFALYSTIVKDLMDQLSIARSIAGRVNGRLAKIKFSNCKVLASKIVLYDVDKVEPQVLESLDAAYKFMLYSYKGFFCEICDGAKNKFVFDADGFVILHKNHCRETVVGNIKAMYYLKVLFVNFVNLVTKFMNNCDAKGTFYDDVMMSQLVLQGSQDDRIIERCWNDRNSPKWLEECKDFCDKFNFVSLSDFFKPYAYKFSLITAFLKKRALQMVSQETLDSSIDMPASSGTPGLLEDMGVGQAPPLKFLDGFTDSDFQDADAKAQMVLKSMGGSSIITAISGSGSPIDMSTYVYMDKGFNFYGSGRETLVQTTDDGNEPGTPMSSKDSFTVARSDNRVGIPTQGAPAGGSRKLVDSDSGLDSMEETQSEQPHPSAHHKKARHARSLNSLSLTRVSVGLLAVLLGVMRH